MNYPIYKEIPFLNPENLFDSFSAEYGAVFLDSALLQVGCGRYSFIGIDPFFILQTKSDTSNPLDFLQEELKKYPLMSYPNLPPFQGGVVGFLSYDLCHHLEIIPKTHDEMGFPDLVFGFYDLVMGFDNVTKQAWIFSSGYPLIDHNEREKRAELRCNWLFDIISQYKEKSLSKLKNSKVKIESNFTKKQYEAAVLKVKNYISAGDIFQANISQRFKALLTSDFIAYEYFKKLRALNPAPFSAYLNFGPIKIASASPERFLKLSSKQIETRPIKGTIARGKNPEEDKKLALTLQNSSKDIAENVMIVDLLRNDLSRVCEKNSVKVPSLCGLESFANVHHLVSVVNGTLKDEYNAIDLLKATFPGGSITGAPKIRAMEIIAEIEKLSRGPYCGCVAYIGFNGNMDTSITIRTLTFNNNIVTFQAGGAVTLDSSPTLEYDETLIKAKTLLRALE